MLPGEVRRRQQRGATGGSCIGQGRLTSTTSASQAERGMRTSRRPRRSSCPPRTHSQSRAPGDPTTHVSRLSAGAWSVDLKSDVVLTLAMVYCWTSVLVRSLANADRAEEEESASGIEQSAKIGRMRTRTRSLGLVRAVRPCARGLQRSIRRQVSSVSSRRRGTR